MKTTNLENQANKVAGKVITRYVKADGKTANIKLVFQSKLIEKFGEMARQIERDMLAELDETEGKKVSEECATVIQQFKKKYYAGAGVIEEKEKLTAEEVALLRRFGTKI